jgi:hypothetical protein
MSLSSAKAKLDAQGGDPATGYISKQDHKDSYDQLVADTALTGATTAEAVAVSGTTDASSATTGTLKTAGGLGVAKKAYVGTDLAVGGALTVGTTVNGRDPDDLAKGAASSTDNALVRFDGTDGKTVQNSGITVDDSNNVTGLGTVASGAVTSSAAVQAAAGSGFVVGSSGPKIMSGTGSPESVVTAPVGSTWTDTAATTGAIQWMKASGTGNTGWVVQYGDTGLRNLSAVALENGWAVASSVFRLRRTGSVVSLTIGATKTSATSDIIYTLPSGFRPPSSFYAVSSSATDDYANASVSSGGLLILSRTYMTVATHYLSLTYQTSDPWPSTLPGTA